MSSPRSVLHLAWPLVLSFWMRQLFTFVDTWFAAEIGDHAVAGIGLAFPYEFLMVAFWVGTSTGMTSLLSRAMGAREGERFDQIIRITRTIVAVLVPVFMVLGTAIWFRPSWFTSEGVAPDTLEQFRIYGSVIVAGTALTGFWSIIPDSIVKAHHDTRATMWAGISSNLLNVALNIVFVKVFHWGMFGIAFSTVIGRLGGLVYALGQAARHEARRRAATQDDVPGIDPRPYASILKLAVPASVAYVLMATESAIVNALLARGPAPTESLAAYSIYYRYLMFFLMPVIACGVALLPFTARAWGQRDVASIRKAWREVLLAGSAYALLFVAPIVVLLRRPLVERFATAALTREMTEWAIVLVPAACIVAIPFFACRPVFEGMQRGGPGMAMAVLRYVVLTAPLAWLGVRLARAAGASDFAGLIVALVAVTAIVSLAFLTWMRLALREAERDRQPAPAT